MPAMIEACDRPVMFELHQTAELSHWHGNRTDPAWQGSVDDARIAKVIAEGGGAVGLSPTMAP